MEEAEVVERLREAAERTGDQDFSEAASLIERQQQVIDLLMKAVEPFANYEINPELSDSAGFHGIMSISPFRRAREAKLEAEKLLNSTPSTAL